MYHYESIKIASGGGAAQGELLPHPPTRSKKPYTQYLAAFGVLLLMIQVGIMGGWTSPNIIRLTSANSPIPITLSEASWVASILNLGRFVGVALLSFLLECLGSKKTVLFTLIPMSFSWILMMTVNNVEGLYAARTIAGVSFGLAFGCFSLYLGEVSVPKYRGTMISFCMVGLQLGNVIGTVTETYLNMQVSSSIYLAESLLAIAIFLYLPESPYHLVKVGDIERAKRSIAMYRYDREVEEELNDVMRFVESNCGQSVKDKLREFRSPPIMRALILIIVLFSFLQLCGMFTIMFYMEVILTKGKSFLIDPKIAVIYANVISALSICLAVRLIDILGRRILLIMSSSGTTLAMLGLGTHFYLLDSGSDPVNLQWLPLASVFLFTATFAIGLMIVPSTVLSEIFPANIKSIASTVTSFTSAGLGFLSAKSYQPMVDSIGEAYVFWFYAGITVMAIPCALFFMPETKGKTFQQIQDELRG